MSTLIITLPLASAGAPEYEYVLTPDGLHAGAQGRSVAFLLPARGGRDSDVVALLPARALSWHRIALPERVLRSLLSGRLEPARARGVLTGLLEEQLLDDAEQLHFAVFAAVAAAEGAMPQAWIAVCDRTWLQTGLQTLEGAGYRVGRMVAECTPTQPGMSKVLLSSELQPAQILLCTERGVSLLPLVPASLALAQAERGLEVLVEPTVMALAEQHFGSLATLQTRAQGMLLAAQSPWNLAQLELSDSPGGRLRKRIAGTWQHVLHAAAWRPARWAALALVLVHVVALNAMAWRQRSLQDERRAAIQAVLKQSFPDVQLVIDAPLQMQRAVDDLAQARGMGSGVDLGRVLAVIGPLLPSSAALTAIDLSGKQLQLATNSLDPASSQKLTTALDANGLRAHWQGTQLFITPKESR